MKRLRVVALASVIALLATACGSGGGRGLDMARVINDDASPTTGITATGATATTGDTDATDATTAGTAASTSLAANGARTGSSTTARAGKTVLGRGVKADRVILGWEGLSDTTAAAVSGVGVTASSASEAAQKTQVGALIKDLNARGGIGGKPVEMVYHFVDVTSGTADSRAQQTCEFFTSDHDVFAVVVSANHNGTLSRCLAQHKTPMIDISSTVLPVDQKDLNEQYGYLYLPSHLNLSRLGAYIDSLSQQGFLDKGAKVGLLRYDYPAHQRARDQVIVPALARHGVALTDDFAFTPVREIADLGSAAAQASNAVLRFKAKGINRVVFLPSGWVILTVFPAAAKAGGFNPIYGVDSWESPEFLRSNVAAKQLKGAVGLGWLPKDDLDPTTAVAYERSFPNWGHCAAALKSVGFPEDRATYCTAFLFLQAAIAQGTGLTPAGLRAGADKLGTTSYSTANFGTFYGPGRSDGAALGRNIAFKDDCGCFKYVSDSYPIP